MRHWLLAFILLPLQAQDPIQKLVESLYPANSRLKEIRMPEIVHQPNIHDGSQVADAGCGAGEFSAILARGVGSAGKVYCEDIVDERDWGIRKARANLKKQHIKNAVVIRGSSGDPKLSEGPLDAVLIVNAYHEMPQYQSMLRHIQESLKPGGRLVILDNTPFRTARRPREKQTANHVLSPDLAAPELQTAGFSIIDREDTFIDNPD